VKEQKFIKKLTNKAFRTYKTIQIADNEKLLSVLWDRVI